MEFGWTFQWTSSWDFPSPMALLQFWWWSTVSLKGPILVLYPHAILHTRSPPYLWTSSASCMVSPEVSFQIETQSSLARSGKNFFDLVAPSCDLAPCTIQRPMDKQKSLITFWNSIYVHSCMIVHPYCTTSWHWQNGVTRLPLILVQGYHHSKIHTTNLPRPLHHHCSTLLRWKSWLLW